MQGAETSAGKNQFPTHLRIARAHEFQQLNLLVGVRGKIGMAALALAEEGLAAGNKKDAQQQALRAKALLPKTSPGYTRANNIQREAGQMEDSAGGVANVR